MEFLLVINCLVAVVNTILLVAIAGTTAKMLRYLGSESEETVLGPSAESHLVDLPRQPSYADMMSAPNYDGFQPRPPNSDGVGGLIGEP